MDMINRAKKTKIVVFTDSHVMRTPSGRHVPARDQFPRFITPLARKAGSLVLACRCQASPEDYSGTDPIDENATQFVELPFYANTRDYLKRGVIIRRLSLPIIKRLVADSDIVFLRIHHSLEKHIAKVASAAGKPIVAYWAGPPIEDTVRASHSGRSPLDVAARWVASKKQKDHKWIAEIARHNFIIDPATHAALGSPLRSQWIVPSLVTDADIVKQVPQRYPDEPLKICFAGRVLRHKGIFELLVAFEHLVNSGRHAQLEICGDGSDREEAEKFTRDRGIKNVIFYGALEYRQLMITMAEGHVYVLPSYAEGMPKGIWEAWASGLVVVTTAVGAIPNHVHDEQNGLMVEVANETSLCQVLFRLHDDDALRRKLSGNGMASVREHTWDMEIKKISDQIDLITSTC